MFGIGTTEFLVILLVAVLVLGPEHLPRIMRTFSKVMSDFRRVSTDFQRAVNLEANQDELRRQHEEEALARKKKKKKKVLAEEETEEIDKPLATAASGVGDGAGTETGAGEGGLAMASGSTGEKGTAPTGSQTGSAENNGEKYVAEATAAAPAAGTVAVANEGRDAVPGSGIPLQGDRA